MLFVQLAQTLECRNNNVRVYWGVVCQILYQAVAIKSRREGHGTLTLTQTYHVILLFLWCQPSHVSNPPCCMLILSVTKPAIVSIVLLVSRAVVGTTKQPEHRESGVE